jgi:transcriptional regulator with XRE-family HTH domain
MNSDTEHRSDVRKIKQVDIAKFVGLSSQTISHIRLGKRSLSKSTAKKMSIILQIPFEALALSNGESLYQLFVQVYLRAFFRKNKSHKPREVKA